LTWRQEHRHPPIPPLHAQPMPPDRISFSPMLPNFCCLWDWLQLARAAFPPARPRCCSPSRCIPQPTRDDFPHPAGRIPPPLRPPKSMPTIYQIYHAKLPNQSSLTQRLQQPSTAGRWKSKRRWQRQSFFGCRRSCRGHRRHHMHARNPANQVHLPRSHRRWNICECMWNAANDACIAFDATACQPLAIAAKRCRTFLAMLLCTLLNLVAATAVHP
jgi:hypothetical protein